MRPKIPRPLRALGIGAAIAVGASLGLLAPTALAAPANDNFAARASLGDALPVHVSESNIGATREEGEHISDFAKGRSIWWEWEAPSDGWTTVSTCGSGFQTVLNIFEGTELGHLTPLVDKRSNGDEGPQCWASEMTYTFDATAGHHYVIGADGNAFYLPPPPGEGEAHIPSGEGTVDLTIEATPPPVNDDFFNATQIGENLLQTRQSPFEEPSEDEFFWEEARGYNWGATKEAGEPDHAGDPGGASVWFVWTPTRSGEAWISLQSAGGPRLLALYEGSALSALTPVGSPSPNLLPDSVQAQVIAGHQYRIAVDGSHSEHPLEPWRGSFMGAFEIGIQLKSPPLAQCASCGLPSSPRPSPPAPQPIFPAVSLGAHRVDAGAGQATFRFSSTAAGATFVCKLDGKAYRACASPFKVKGLKPGQHVFRVLATMNGTTSTSPGVVHFSVRAPQRRHHQAG